MTDPSPKHRSPLTVRFADVDSAGIVYYPRFLHYCHVGMEEYFLHVADIDYAEVMGTHRIGFPTVRVEADFARPLRYGDKAEITTEVERMGGSSVTWRHAITKKGGELSLAAQIVTVALDLDRFEKVAVPDWFRRVAATSTDR